MFNYNIIHDVAGFPPPPGEVLAKTLVKGSLRAGAIDKDVSAMQKHRDKLAYFFIAFAIILLIRALGGIGRLTVTTIMLYVSIAVTLLASNMPRVLDIPLHYAYPVRCVEYFTFGTAVVCFIALCLHHMLLA